MVLVPRNSPIQSIAQLRERKAAFQKGSNTHNLLLRTLQQAELKFTSIQPTYLTSADARAAFQQENVGTWAIWDPYYPTALPQGDVRVLKGGSDLEQTGLSCLAARPYAERNNAFVPSILGTFSQTDALTLN